MTGSPKMIAAAAVGGLVLLFQAPSARAQSVPPVVTRVAALASGSIGGVVQDERGAPIPGAMVSALGAKTTIAVTDRGGRFELRPLSPGPYLIRAHETGYVGSRGQIVLHRPSHCDARLRSRRPRSRLTFLCSPLAWVILSRQLRLRYRRPPTLPLSHRPIRRLRRLTTTTAKRRGASGICAAASSRTSPCRTCSWPETARRPARTSSNRRPVNPARPRGSRRTCFRACRSPVR